MGTFLIVLVGLTLVGLGVLVLYLGMRTFTVNDMDRRINEFVAVQPSNASRMNQEVSVQRADLTGSFRTRMLEPFIRQVGGLFGRLTPSSSIDSLAHQLDIAERPYGLGPREFYGLRIVFMIIGILAAFYIIQQQRDIVHLIGAILAGYVGIFGPSVWLKRRVRKRQDQIRKGLPDALDMLSVTAEAGLGFDQSLQRVSEYWKTPVGVEFGRVVAEMEMGISRQQALRNMADRLDVHELSSFVAVIIQSDQLGMSIADALHAQAEQMRVERRFRAQEAARKVPLKMLFPMLLLIFPAMLAVVCGPSIPILSDFFRALGGQGFGIGP
ncbi:MAG: type II secretion system F family protein [Anaerolineales bacterium]